MDIIKMTSDLADILKEKDLAHITVRENDFEITVTGRYSDHFYPPIGNIGAALNTPEAVQAALTQKSANDESGNFVKSPIIGTFYAAPAPEKPPFVKVGDKVEKGQVVCIVESMKLMNEITSEFGGTVAEILVKDGEAVEFDKKLIRIV